MHNDSHPTAAAMTQHNKMRLKPHNGLQGAIGQQTRSTLQQTSSSLATIQQVFQEERAQYNIAPAKIKGVKISYSQIAVTFDDGSRLSAPLDAYPYPKQATSENRAKWEALRWQAWKHLGEMRRAKLHQYKTKRPDAFSPLNN